LNSREYLFSTNVNAVCGTVILLIAQSERERRGYAPKADRTSSPEIDLLNSDHAEHWMMTYLGIMGWGFVRAASMTNIWSEDPFSSP
jgi:hypothetical protein